MFLIQMAGFPGSGKSTLAREIAKNMDVIILDNDVVKTAILESGVPSNLAANASYKTTFSLCEYYLGLNKSIIIDSPCFYTETLEHGIKLAERYNARYRYIECRVNDFKEISKRLQSREKKLSQIASTTEEVFLNSIDKSKFPIDSDYLIVDSSLPIATNIQNVINYINSNER